MNDSDGFGCTILFIGFIILMIICYFSVIWPFFLLVAIIGVIICLTKTKINNSRYLSDNENLEFNSSKPIQNPMQETKKESLDHLSLCMQGAHYIGDNCKCKICGVELHNFIKCHCAQCGETQHIWEGCICVKCGSTRDIGHIWDGCKCLGCGSLRGLGHAWAGCKCSVCGTTREQGHSFDFNGYCKRCGLYDPDKKVQPKKYCSGVCSECRREVCLEDKRQ